MNASVLDIREPYAAVLPRQRFTNKERAAVWQLACTFERAAAMKCPADASEILLCFQQMLVRQAKPGDREPCPAASRRTADAAVAGPDVAWRVDAPGGKAAQQHIVESIVVFVVLAA